ncbi:MAG: hypothetical protein K6L81_17460 [Agarilytica sp.]
MAVVAIVWELGAGLGHISRLFPIAHALKKHGHRPVFVLKDMANLALVSDNHTVECIQAPIWVGHYTNVCEPLNFSDTLLRIGYQNRNALSSMIIQWVNIFERINPALILFDHSPTAMLASRKFDCPKIQIGTDFSVLPCVTPLPRYKFWARSSNQPDKQLLESEEHCLTNINYALAKIGVPRIDAVHRIYDTYHTFIDTHSLLDVYGKRQGVEYLGVFRRADIGVSPVWPFTNKPKVFLYLKSRYQHIEALLQACHATDAQFLIYSAGIGKELVQRFTSPHMIFSDQPFKINAVIQSCDCAINHASGIAELLLQQGKPQILLPMPMEQLMRAKKIISLGAAQLFDMKDSPVKLGAYVHRMITTGRCEENTQAVAEGLEPINDIPDIEKILNRIDAFLLSPLKRNVSF